MTLLLKKKRGSVLGESPCIYDVYLYERRKRQNENRSRWFYEPVNLHILQRSLLK